MEITNIVMSGKLPEKIKLPLSYEKIMLHTKLNCNIVNEDMSPIFTFRFEKEGQNIHKKKRYVCVSIWHKGSCNIVGVTSEQEGLRYYDIVVNELTKIQQELKNGR